MLLDRVQDEIVEDDEEDPSTHVSRGTPSSEPKAYPQRRQDNQPYAEKKTEFGDWAENVFWRRQWVADFAKALKIVYELPW
jgi:hypothetical protein